MQSWVFSLVRWVSVIVLNIIILGIGVAIFQKVKNSNLVDTSTEGDTESFSSNTVPGSQSEPIEQPEKIKPSVPLSISKNTSTLVISKDMFI
jgi:hypothetical protein